MPILGAGYEPYRGTLRKDRFPFLPIARAAVRRNLRWWTWLLLALSLLAGSGFWYFIVLLVYGGPAMIPEMHGRPPAQFLALADSPGFFPGLLENQMIWALLMATLVGAGEIAEDLRSGALVFYLGRPLTRRDYVLGKVAAVAGAVLAVTLAPALLLFVIQALFESNWAWVASHLRVAGAVVAFTLLEAAFLSCFVLGISALASRRRWATVAVVAVFAGLVLTSQLVAVRRDMASERERWALEERFERADSPEEAKAIQRQIDDSYDSLGSVSPNAGLRCVSPYHSLVAAGRDLFGERLPGNFSFGRHWIVLILLAGGLGAALLRRVRAVEIVT